MYWVVGIATAVLYFVSVLLHELGHSVVALAYKIPVRSITLFMFGGVAHIGAEPPNARAEFCIAIAGPLVSIALATVFSALQMAAAAIQPLYGLAKYLALINLALGAFNLIPGYPLDGGRVFRAAVWAVTHDLQRATLIATGLGRGFGFLFIVVGAWQMLGGQPDRRATDCFHRLVSGERRGGTGRAGGSSRCAARLYRVTSHACRLRHCCRQRDTARVGGSICTREGTALLPGQPRG